MGKSNLPSITAVKKQLFADWALRVKSRDNFRCVLCDNKENLATHHWFCASHHAHAARFCEHNGVCLCYTCHIRTIHSRADWASLKPLADTMWRILPPNAEDIITSLSNVELTTTVLRLMWNEMRSRVILLGTEYATHSVKRGSKWFLTVECDHPIAVVGNTIRELAGHGVTEVTAVAKADKGYRYTLKALEEQS